MQTSNRSQGAAPKGVKILSKSSSLPAQPFDQSSNGGSDWKQEVNQRLAAHRNRRGGPQESADPNAAPSQRPANDRVAQLQARVAARYAKAPSYSEALAGEARAVVRAAGVAAQAARTAQAAAEAVLANLESGFETGMLWDAQPAASKPAPKPAPTQYATPVAPIAPPRWQDEPPAAKALPEPQLRPRWEETLPVMATPQVTVETAEEDVWAEMRVHPGPYREPTRPSVSDRLRDEMELFPFNEIDPRAGQDPIQGAIVEPAQHIAANLIEFPRELVAPRKARPRQVEGPYRRNAENEASPQLSIFEVDPELLDPPMEFARPAAQAIAPPEWATMEFDHHPEPAWNQPGTDSAPAISASAVIGPSYNPEAFAESTYVEADAPEVHYEEAAYSDLAYDSPVAVGPATFAPVEYTPSASSAALHQQAAQAVVRAEPQAQPTSVELLVAPVSDRALAVVVDLSLVTLAYVAAAFVAMASMDHLPGVRTALISSAIGIVLIGLLYQYIFLSFAEEGTPGMRYARIALCTFNDDNPTREQMRMRIPAMLLAGLPVGLGLAWAIFDKEHVGWHDRWTKTYQRKY